MAVITVGAELQWERITVGADILYNYKEVVLFMHSGGVSRVRLRSTFLNFSPKCLFVLISHSETE